MNYLRLGLYEQYVNENEREDVISAKLDAGLSAKRIFQDLVMEHGFVGGYDSVKRFLRRINNKVPLPFRRMECDPGSEAQMDLF